MESKSFLSDFLKYNRKILKRLILIIVIVLYFAFLVMYNYFRVTLSLSVENSWLFGFISALISSIVLIIAVDTLWFIIKGRK